MPEVRRLLSTFRGKSRHTSIRTSSDDAASTPVNDAGVSNPVPVLLGHRLHYPGQSR